MHAYIGDNLESVSKKVYHSPVPVCIGSVVKFSSSEDKNMLPVLLRDIH